MPRTTSAAFGIVTVGITVLGWSSVPLFLRHFAESIDPWTSNGWRYGFSALVWLPVLIAVGMRRRLPRGLWAAALVPSIVNAAGQVCFTYAHYRIDPALLTFGLRCQLLFVAVGAWIMFPAERKVIRTPMYLLGAALLICGMIGVLLLDRQDDSTSLAPAPDAISVAAAPMESAIDTGAKRDTRAAHVQGVLLALASGLLFACYGLSVRKFMVNINSVIAFAAICQYTAAVMLVLMFVLGKSGGATVFKMPGGEVLLLLASALIGIAFGHMFYYMSIARLGVAVTAGVLQLQPFFVALGSVPLFGERLGPGQWAGGCVAVLGALLMLSVQYRISRVKNISEKPLAIAEGESGA